jgi:hypothetical protein
MVISLAWLSWASIFGFRKAESRDYFDAHKPHVNVGAIIAETEGAK